MKHIFVVETADDKPLSPRSIDFLTEQIQTLVEHQITEAWTCPDDGTAFATSICNQPSAVRGIYRLYQLDQSQSPDQIGCSK